LIVSLPLHFYITSELENSEYRDREMLQKYAQKVANRIYTFSNSSEREFYFPRSNLFQGALYDQAGNSLFSLQEQPFILEDEGFAQQEGYRYYTTILKGNVFDAYYLVIAKKNTHAKLIVNVLVILMVTALLVFLALFFILRQSTEPHRQLHRYLENFIKDAMHEMKTPLGVILLNLDGLSSLYENNTMILRAKSALKNMIVVYEDLEFFVKTNRVHHPKQQIDFSDFCHERIEFFGDLLRAKNIKVTSDIGEDIVLCFSRLELSRIIDNTLSNAIKYSKNATEITLSLYEKDQHSILKICDQGRGIENISRIFERYYRGDKISGGFGIGLNIVKKICDQHHVEIQVLSTEGHGTCFNYAFPKKEKKTLN
jgi:signal transduction histidine kinase